MKKLIVFILFLIFVFIQNAYCQIKGDDDLIWMKDFLAENLADEISKVKFSPNGEYLAVGCRASNLYLFNASSKINS